MTEAWRTIPAATLYRTVPFASLLAARERLAGSSRQKPSLDVLITILAARTLAELDLLNGSWLEEERAVLVHPQRNVAIAVDTPHGLTAIVLRDADGRSVSELDAEFVTMLERARAGRSFLADVADATFTITNVGGLGVEWFNPIITPPQSGVLGVGAIRPTPRRERPAILALTFDHRVADGADAARFLRRLAERITEAQPGDFRRSPVATPDPHPPSQHSDQRSEPSPEPEKGSSD
jgi:pyruvate dehydrogenase E2 component (dihydrolipoamide acetyltransferase)